MDGWQQMNSDDLPSHIILSKMILNSTCYFFSFWLGLRVYMFFIFPRKDNPSSGLCIVHQMLKKEKKE
jgi:hypothetical protein